MSKEDVMTCPSCKKEMSQICEGNVRVIMGKLITLPGALLGYRCAKCGHSRYLCPSCGNKNTEEHLPSVYSMFEEKNGYGICFGCKRSFGFDDNGKPIQRPWQMERLIVNAPKK